MNSSTPNPPEAKLVENKATNDATLQIQETQVVTLSHDTEGQLQDSSKLESVVITQPQKSLDEALKTSSDISYTWSNLSCTTIKKNGKCFPCSNRKKQQVYQILKNVSGVVKSGQLLAIMGSSGVGKTTLLNLLNFRRGEGSAKLKVTGQCRVNGTLVSPALMSSISAYVYQDDVFVARLKVKEHLSFCSKLRMPSNLTTAERNVRVEEIMRELGLWHIRNSFIGDKTGIKGISGGERRRLAVATELLTEPRLLFLDGPVSGLDSYLAQTVIKMLKKTANKGKAIICTIHSPSTEIFKMFDSLYLLTEGRVAYAGPRDGALKFFEQVGYKCPITHNPADFYMHTLAIQPDKTEECLQKTATIVYAYEQTEQYAEILAVTQAQGTEKEKGHISLHPVRHYNAGWCQQFIAITIRTSKLLYREPASSWIRIGQNCLIAIIVGSMFWNQKLDINGVNSINSLLISTLFLFTFLIGFPVIYTFSGELQLFHREYCNGMYTTSSYYLAKSLAELPVLCTLPFLTLPIIFYMSNLTGGFIAMLWQTLILVLVTLIISSISYFTSTLTNSVNGAIILLVGLIIPALLFSEFFIEESAIRIPGMFYYNKACWGFHALENMFVIQWREVKKIEAPPPIKPVFKTGSDVLHQFKYHEKNFLRNFFYLVGNIVIFRVAAFVILHVKAKRR